MKPFVALMLFAAALAFGQEPAGPEQPIPYSHKLHAGTLKLQCKMCHPNPDPGEIMTLPKAATCMQCHSSVKTDSPAIQKLAAFAKNGREPRWVRIYQIPAYVFFNHRAHVQSGSTCADCHGQVATRDRLFKETDISMGACMNCHRSHKASIDCQFCHEERH